MLFHTINLKIALGIRKNTRSYSILPNRKFKKQYRHIYKNYNTHSLSLSI